MRITLACSLRGRGSPSRPPAGLCTAGCAAARTHAHLSLGVHVFRVRATYGDANTGIPAKHSFRLVRR
jgi:hypothetical protein